MIRIESIGRSHSEPSLAVRFASHAVYLYLALSPFEKGKHRLWKTAAQFFLVSQLKEGPWIRTSGLTDAEKLLFMKGLKEPRSVKFVCEFIRPGMVAIDVGANIGYYSLILGACVGSAGSVHAFEPTPALAERLRLNSELNGFTQLAINQVAVADKVGSAWLQMSHDDFEANSLFTVDSLEGRILVPTVTLDAYILERGIHVIDFMKIDCEGAELIVLKGATKLLHRDDAPLLMLECNAATLAACGTTISELSEYLRRASYECYTLETLRVDPQPVWNLLAIKPHHVANHTVIRNWGLQRFETP